MDLFGRLLTIDFDHPLILLALAPALLLVPLLAGSRLRGFARWQRRTVVALRCLIVASLIVALAGPNLIFSEPSRSYVFAIDVSQSVSPAQQEWARNWVRDAMAQLGEHNRSTVIEFGERAQFAALDEVATEPPPGAATSLEEALRLARSILPDGGGGERQIVLLTDGWENSGQAETTISSTGTQGGGISYVPIDLAGSLSPEVSVASAGAPSVVRTGDVLDLAVVIHSTEATTGTIRLEADGQPVLERPIELTPGINRLTLNPRAETTGFHTFRVSIVPASDTVSGNNVAEVVTVAKDSGRVLVIENRPGEAAELVGLLTADGLQVETQPVDNIPPTAQELVGFDSAILVNTPATSLTLDQQTTLQLFVRELGRGLIVVGGPLSFGPGGYEGTVLEEMLPVSPEPPEEPVPGDLALFLVVDKSGSMDVARGGEPPKLTMARAAAVEAAGLLSPNDVVGVIAFDHEFEWVVPTTRLGSQDDIRGVQSRIAAIKSGGGTSILPALEEAYEAAVQTSTRLKHIVLLTDGQSTGSGFEDLASRMRPQKITLSTVAIGSDADTELLIRLADLGMGRYYFTERSSQIPRIASKEASILTQNAVVEGQTAARVGDPSPLLRDISGDFPPLNGYVATTRRERAVTALETPRGDPLLAHWQYGVGRVVAWTSDSAIAGWAAGWSGEGWPGGERFWAQIVRWSMPAPGRPDFQVSARLEPDGRRAVLRAESFQDDGSFADLLDTRATVLLPDGTAREIMLPQRGPGTYERTVTVAQPGVYRVLFQQQTGDADTREELAGFSVPEVGPERRTVGVNRHLLTQLAERTGGREVRSPSDLLNVLGAPRMEDLVPLWPWLVGLAAVLFPLDVAARRLRWAGAR